MKGYADRELEDLVRSAFAEMMPQLLDESAPRSAVESRSDEQAVPAPVGLREASDDSNRPPARILVGAAVLALVVAGLALIGRDAVTNDSTNSPVSNQTAAIGGTPTPTVDGSVPVAAPYLAPLALPPGWKVWTFSRSSVSNPSDTTQVFGRYEGTPLLSAAILVNTSKVSGGHVDGSVAVRGQQAVLSSGPTESNLSWGEDGLDLNAQFRGITVDQAVEFLDILNWRADHRTGFDPASAPPELPLQRETIAAPTEATLQTIYRIVPTDGPTFVTTQLSTYGGADSEIQLTAWAGPEAPAAPYIVFRGERQPDGSIAYHAPEGVGPQHEILRPDGSIVSVLGPGDSDLLWTVVSSMGPATGADVDNLENETSAILEGLPEVGRATVGDATIVLRGGTADQPIAQCLVTTDAKRCRRNLPAQVSANLGFVAAVNLNGRWFLYGNQPSGAPSVQVLPWAAGMSAEIDPGTRLAIGVTSAESGAHRWWVSEVPAGRGVDDVVVVASTDTQIDAGTLRTAFHRNDWTGQGN